MGQGAGQLLDWQAGHNVLIASLKSISRLKSSEIPTGFSIVELMIVLSVLSILFAVGMPAFGRFLQDIEIRGSAEGLRAALQTARTEAVTRNALVRISFNDKAGKPAWTLGCVHVSARCPEAITTYSAATDTQIRWGSARADDLIQLDAALEAGHQMPASVTFNAFGAAPGVASGTDALRIDITHSTNKEARRLLLMIAAAGTVRLCDPSAASDSVLRCI